MDVHHGRTPVRGSALPGDDGVGRVPLMTINRRDAIVISRLTEHSRTSHHNTAAPQRDSPLRTECAECVCATQKKVCAGCRDLERRQPGRLLAESAVTKCPWQPPHLMSLQCSVHTMDTRHSDTAAPGSMQLCRERPVTNQRPLTAAAAAAARCAARGI